MRKYCSYCGTDADFVEYHSQDAELREHSHAVLWGNSHAVLREHSHAVLRENSHAVLREHSHAECSSPYACAILKSPTAKCIGRHVGDKPIAPKAYLESCGIEVKNQSCILYKSVTSDFNSYHNSDIQYIIGTETIAPDWDKDATIECGKGLHLSPTIQQARTFHDDGLYLACRVKLSDMANLPAFAEYPDKIRVRACVPLYQVSKEGERI